MNAAREEILGAVRRACGDGRAAAPSLPTYRRQGRLSAAERVTLFAARVSAYRAHVGTVSSRSIQAALAEVAAGRPFGVPAGLPHEWRPALHLEDETLSLEDLDALAGVVTGCTVAIAETGTIVLSGQADEGRRALTLVPDLHVCLVEEARIVETVPEAFDRLASYADRPLTFISGPSATSDIELRRVEGVHGPRQLVVLIMTSEEGSVV